LFAIHIKETISASVGSPEVGDMNFREVMRRLRGRSTKRVHMDRDEAIKLLSGGLDGVAEWNRRSEAGEVTPDLSVANLRGVNLIMANLRGADLSQANLRRANLSQADLSGADLSHVNLRVANFSQANLSGAFCGSTVFADVDLSEAKGLESVEHLGPCTVGIDTLFRSKGNIPEAFHRGSGVPESVAANRFALIGAMEPIQFYSCFISYSTTDEDFAKRLHSKMRDQGMRVWFAPEDIQGGKKLHEQVDEAIRVFDKLLLVLSPNRINSKWVRDEIRRARKSEIREGRKKLFPVRLMDYTQLEDWKSFYADLAEDVAEEIREYFIPDFSNWKEHDSFEQEFGRLLRDLKAPDTTGPRAAPPA
jgi:hypothetical protein